MKAVFDTNVLIAAFLTEGICAKLMVRAHRRDFDLVLCDGILQEFKHVLKKKFASIATAPAKTATTVDKSISLFPM